MPVEIAVSLHNAGIAIAFAAGYGIVYGIVWLIDACLERRFRRGR